MKRTICILCSLCFCCVCAIGEEEPEESEILMQPAVSIVEDAVTIEGDVILSSDENDVIGISIEKNNGKTNEVTITGAVYAECKPGTEVTDTKAYGMVVSASGEGTEVAVTVQDSVSAAATVTEGNTDAGAVDISTSEGASAEVRVWGSVSAAAMQERDSYTWAAGVSVYNSDSRADVIVDGNVQADSAVYGVGINCRQSGDNETYSVIRVNGDVTAETLGILSDQGNPLARAEIIVDGTVRGGDSAILFGFQPENTTITVWKAETGTDGRLVSFMDDDAEHITDPEPEEKRIQYILRIKPGYNSAITLEDAEEYKGFLIAREGEKVSVVLHYPAIYEVEGVYADESQSIALDQTEDGKYTLEVPRGGGVELSVQFRNADAYGTLLTDLISACTDPSEAATARIDEDAAAAGSPLALSVAESWKTLYLDPEYKLLIDGLDDPAQLNISGRHAFVVPGFQLENGEMTEELKGRCDAAASAAKTFPDSIIICSGGATGENNPEGHTEAGLMKAYLSEQYGIDPARIFTDESATTTAENALNTMAILEEQQIETMTIITSDYHQRRTQTLYNLTAARYAMEQGWSVEITGNYNTSIGTDEETTKGEFLLTIVQMCEILELPEEQSAKVYDAMPAW